MKSPASTMPWSSLGVGGLLKSGARASPLPSLAAALVALLFLVPLITGGVLVVVVVVVHVREGFRGTGKGHVKAGAPTRPARALTRSWFPGSRPRKAEL